MAKKVLTEEQYQDFEVRFSHSLFNIFKLLHLQCKLISKRFVSSFKVIIA